MIPPSASTIKITSFDITNVWMYSTVIMNPNVSPGETKPSLVRKLTPYALALMAGALTFASCQAEPRDSDDWSDQEVPVFGAATHDEAIITPLPENPSDAVVIVSRQ